MTKITYIEYDGTRHAIDMSDGQSVMQGAIRNGVPGIDADCGGACACATCHVYVATEWAARLPAPDETELSMLEFVENRAAHSRLSCQIKVDPTMDGLEVRLPASQR